jgi:hypothetical protein
MDNYILTGIGALLAVQIGIFWKTKKPNIYFMEFSWEVMDEQQKECARADQVKWRTQYHKDLRQFYSVFVTPMVFTVLAFSSVWDFFTGLVFFIVAVVSTIVSVVLSKHYDIGNKNFP